MVAVHAPTQSIDPNDPFLVERLYSHFSPQRLDREHDALAQLDWIGGFTDDGSHELEAFVTPIL